MFKKLVMAGLVLLFIVSLAGCAEKKAATKTEEPPAKKAQQKSSPVVEQEVSPDADQQVTPAEAFR